VLSKKVDLSKKKRSETDHTTAYGLRYFDKPVPKYVLPEDGMPAPAAYQLIHDELNLDGNPTLNLASFVTTWMEPEARLLVVETLDKNYVDNDEYPQTTKIQEYAVNMLARLFHAPEDCKSVGTATIGSSEAIMLGLLAHKWSWRNRRRAEGKPLDKPNVIMGADVHTVWEKFARYFDVELKLIPLQEDTYTINADEVAEQIDENTICVGAVVGTTFTGQMDPVKEINDLLVEIKQDKDWDIPLHVDGASGGFVVPFVHPDLEWDFRLEQVRSINVSGHKYGLVYPGIGWLVMRDKTDLPDDLVFRVNYLGGEMTNYSLNFSKGSSMILAQYYNFIRLGKSGYTDIMMNMMRNSQYLAEKLRETGKFEIINKQRTLPLVAMRLEDANFTVFQLSDLLRQKGWIVPAYYLPENAQDVAVMRMVIKENFSLDLVESLFDDVMGAYNVLEQSAAEKVHKKRDDNLTLLY